MTTIRTSDAVAAREAAALAEYYRNRCLILAQALSDTQAAAAASGTGHDADGAPPEEVPGAHGEDL